MARRRYRRYRSKRKSPAVYRRSADDVGVLEGLGFVLVAVIKGIAWVVRRVWAAGRPGQVAAMPPSPRVASVAVAGTGPPPLPGQAGVAASVAVVSGVAAVSPVPLALPARPVSMRYRRRPHLVSRGERAFWHPLYYAVKGKYRIFCKVRLLDVVEPAGGRREARRMAGSIGRYHLDFVLCDPQTTRPLLAIELDDKSHRSARQAERDAYKDQVLAAGGVPLYRVPAQQAYDPIELAEEIERRMRT